MTSVEKIIKELSNNKVNVVMDTDLAYNILKDITKSNPKLGSIITWQTPKMLEENYNIKIGAQIPKHEGTEDLYLKAQYVRICDLGFENPPYPLFTNQTDMTHLGNACFDKLQHQPVLIEGLEELVNIFHVEKVRDFLFHLTKACSNGKKPLIIPTTEDFWNDKDIKLGIYLTPYVKIHKKG